jgi:hypothetical protein
MTPRDPFELWKSERRNVAQSAPAGALADRVMRAIRVQQRERTREGPRRSWVGLGATLFLAGAIQAAWALAILLALSATAT